MSPNSPIFFLEINKKEFIFSVLNEENENLKILHKSILPIQGINENKITDFNLIYDTFKTNILLIEQKLNFTIREVILILDNFEYSISNFTGFKKLNGSQLSRANITYILNSLKSKIDEFEKEKNIVHIFNSRYLIDKKPVENLPIGLFGNLYSQELSFFLINMNDYKNLNNIFSKCNLRLKKIISKNFVKGVNLINKKSNIGSFFRIEIDKNCSQLIYFENSALKFVQDFAFGTNLIIKDISKITALKKEAVEKIVSNLKPSIFGSENNFVEKDFFDDQKYRKIKKELVFDVGKARIEELAEIIFLKNINITNFLKNESIVFLDIKNISNFMIFEKNFSLFFSDQNNYNLEFLNKETDEILYKNVLELVQYGWKKEAVPIVLEKRSLIARFFDLIFK